MGSGKDSALFAGWALLIALFSLYPVAAGGGAGAGTPLDKIQHFTAYFVFSYLALRVRNERSYSNYAMIAVGVLVYSLTLEYFQLFVPGRFFDVYDVAAGMLGALTFFTGVSYANRSPVEPYPFENMKRS